MHWEVRFDLEGTVVLSESIGMMVFGGDDGKIFWVAWWMLRMEMDDYGEKL
jgi:hypothetical protein